MKPISKKHLAINLRQLDNKMIKLGVQMDHYGGFAEYSKHRAEMVGAATLVKEWAMEIEKDET